MFCKANGLNAKGASASAAAASGNETEVCTPGNKGLLIKSQVGAWRVLVDHGRNTCMVEKLDADGNAVQIGLGPRSKRAGVDVFTKLPQDLRQLGERQLVAVEINGDACKDRSKQAQRQTCDACGGIYIPAFSDDGKQTMEFPDCILEIDLSMGGAVQAVDAARICHAELDSVSLQERLFSNALRPGSSPGRGWSC